MFFFFCFTYLVYSINRHCRNGFTMRFVERTVSLLHDPMIHFFWDSLFSDLYGISCIYQDFFFFHFCFFVLQEKK